jgi:glycerate dehydrogenase
MTGSGEPPHVVFLDRDTLSPETRLRAPAFPHRMEVFAKTAPAEVAERIRDAEIVITNKVPLRRSIAAYRDAVIRGRWQDAGQFCFFDYPIRDLAGSTLGIIGDGVLGRRRNRQRRAYLRSWLHG